MTTSFFSFLLIFTSVKTLSLFHCPPSSVTVKTTIFWLLLSNLSHLLFHIDP
ncbi:hypothetical protein ES332_D01G189100v1 [Gossypium tomentosum]|uniref:Uncharacterized protein n=1 Tax=Gossypium tomentosum TaxID=34277 RepID=A0A5D2MAT7_GOSTO|nr:hypothetical protein ES332_D01G189100v1 [Gossypium tomentosum]